MYQVEFRPRAAQDFEGLDQKGIYQADREKKVLTVRLVGHRREIYDQSASTNQPKP